MSATGHTPFSSEWRASHWQASDYASKTRKQRLDFLNDMLAKAHQYHMAEKTGDHQELEQLHATMNMPPYVRVEQQHKANGKGKKKNKNKNKKANGKGPHKKERRSSSAVPDASSDGIIPPQKQYGVFTAEHPPAPANSPPKKTATDNATPTEPGKNKMYWRRKPKNGEDVESPNREPPFLRLVKKNH